MRTDLERSGALRRLRAIGRSGSARQLRMRGMTLIELMIVVAVLAIISTIAVSSYRKYVMRVPRSALAKRLAPPRFQPPGDTGEE